MAGEHELVPTTSVIEDDVELLMQLMVAVSVGCDRSGTLADELTRVAARVNTCDESESARATRHLEDLCVALGIALYEQTGSLNLVERVLAEHWSKT